MQHVNLRNRLAFQLSLIVSASMMVMWMLQTPTQSAFVTPTFLLGLIVAVLSETRPLTFPRFGRLSLAEPLAVAAACLYGPAACALLVLCSAVCRFRNRPAAPLFVAYSISQAILCNCGMALVYQALRGQYRGPLGALELAALSLAVAAAYILQAGIVAFCKFLEQGQVGIWTSRLNWSRLRLAMQAFLPLGALAAAAQQEGVLVFSLLLAPLAVTYSSLHRCAETLREAREVVENLAQAVEKREPHTVGHAQRVSQLAANMARVLHLDEFSVGCVEAAGRLHELGKISVGDRILCKLGQLKDSEWDQLRRYPEVGAKVAARLSLSRKEAELIRFHQERFDGNGYYGVKGQAIPLGARILGAAKAFDAMISRRAYRPALSFSQAIESVRKQAGLQFDPQVVDALLVCLRQRPLALAA